MARSGQAPAARGAYGSNAVRGPPRRGGRRTMTCSGTIRTRGLLALPVLLTVALLAAGLAGGPAWAAGSVHLSASPSPATAGSPEQLTAKVTPKVKGRSITFAVRTGGSWHSLGKVKTDKHGVATLATV